MDAMKFIECPRDAMQGWPHFIPTDQKIRYINALLSVGFDTIDFGSFVSPKAIPQMADTKEVLRGLQPGESQTKLLAIAANLRGAEEAMAFNEIAYIGFPFSISETFQQRNTNSSIEASFATVQGMQQLCTQHQKELVVYISMGFGNPYGDAYDETIVLDWVKKITGIGVNIISLADTVGLATPEQVFSITKSVVDTFSQNEIGVHLHSAVQNREQKLSAALSAGCRRFDAAIKGIGGCPMAGDDLVGNMDTESMIRQFEIMGLSTNIDAEQLALCHQIATEIFV